MAYSEADYLQLLSNLGVTTPKKPKKKSKYNNKKTRVDGILFDSQKEANYYIGLKILTACGEIRGFGIQMRIVIAEGDENTRATEYLPDFVIFNKDGTYRIVDVKGMQTDVFKLKMKMLKEKYPKLDIELE